MVGRGHLQQEASRVESTLTVACLSILPCRSPGRGTKRKFGFDLDAVSKLAEEAEEAAMVKIEREQAESRKAKLPAFWL